jgi:transposase
MLCSQFFQEPVRHDATRCKSRKSLSLPQALRLRKSIDGLAALVELDMESERFKTSPDVTDEAIVLTVQKLNWMLDGFDLWRNRPHQVLTPRFVA